MDNFTGLSPEIFREQLVSFIDMSVYNNSDVFRENVRDFKANLFFAWCSPNAQKFSKEQIPKLFMISDDIELMTSIICRNALSSYEILARANGLPEILREENHFFRDTANPRNFGDVTTVHDKYLEWELRDAGPSGIVGMNKTLVRLALEQLNNASDDCVEKLKNLPTDIAFYDPNDEMQTSFKNLIKKMVEEVHTIINDVKKEVNSALEEEEDRIELAKNQAVETMRA